MPPALDKRCWLFCSPVSPGAHKQTIPPWDQRRQHHELSPGHVKSCLHQNVGQMQMPNVAQAGLSPKPPTQPHAPAGVPRHVAQLSPCLFELQPGEKHRQFSFSLAASLTGSMHSAGHEQSGASLDEVLLFQELFSKTVKDNQPHCTDSLSPTAHLASPGRALEAPSTDALLRAARLDGKEPNPSQPFQCFPLTAGLTASGSEHHGAPMARSPPVPAGHLWSLRAQHYWQLCHRSAAWPRTQAP